MIDSYRDRIRASTVFLRHQSTTLRPPGALLQNAYRLKGGGEGTIKWKKNHEALGVGQANERMHVILNKGICCNNDMVHASPERRLKSLKQHRKQYVPRQQQALMPPHTP